MGQTSHSLLAGMGRRSLSSNGESDPRLPRSARRKRLRTRALPVPPVDGPVRRGGARGRDSPLHPRSGAQDWRDEEALYAHTLAYSPDSARVRLNLGNLYLGRGETGHAAAQFAAGLTAHPDDPDLLTNAGLAWLSLGRFAAAEHALQRVVEIEPDDAQAWANLGAVYGTTGRFDAARRAYENALRRDPSNADAQAGIRILEGITPTP
jgi:tetratricopeptide (TPR) repeat protein